MARRGLIIGGLRVWYATVFERQAMADPKSPQKDAYGLILEAIDTGVFRPGDRLVESDLAERFGVSRTPIREALQRLETQSMLTRDGRSLIVASLDHNQLAELYVVRTELEGLAARLAARHAAPEEVRVLRDMVVEDATLLGDPAGAEPGEPAVSQADTPGQPQPLSGAAIRTGAPLDGAVGNDFSGGGGPRRGGARGTSQRSSRRSPRATARRPMRR